SNPPVSAIDSVDAISPGSTHSRKQMSGPQLRPLARDGWSSQTCGVLGQAFLNMRQRGHRLPSPTCCRFKSSVNRQPLARRALSTRDFRRRHFSSDFLPIARRIAIAFQGRNIEPFMRADEIGSFFDSERTHHAEAEKRFACIQTTFDRRAFHRLHIEMSHFKTLHIAALPPDASHSVDRQMIALSLERRVKRLGYAKTNKI
ncbi:MAG: hypothetical protein KDJ53_10925, partial [Rhodobiaceae bacterium]|nr:hypothetical protein [Rhodobiaceae bacterium]